LEGEELDKGEELRGIGECGGAGGCVEDGVGEGKRIGGRIVA
jgi:hypothetical protein